MEAEPARVGIDGQFTIELLKKTDALAAAVARVPYVLTNKTARIEVELKVWLEVIAALRAWRAARERRE